MEHPDRRQYLEALVESAESDALRLRALEALSKFDEAEGKRLPTADEIAEERAEELADNPSELDKLVAAFAEHWFAFPALANAVEERAARLLAEHVAASRRQLWRDNAPGAAEAAAEAETAEQAEGEVEHDKAASEAEEPSRPDAHSPEVLARQWPSNQPRGVRDIPPARILGLDRFE